MLYEKIALEEGEVVLMTVRKHWLIITLELVTVFIMALVPLFLVVAARQFVPEAGSFFENASINSFMSAAWLLIMIMMGFMAWTNYYLDLWVITDRRIIVIDQRGFFNRKVSSFRLERLQDIKVTIKGIIATLLNYGTVRAQTAGANESNFASTGMPDPRGIQALIQGAMDDRLKVIGGAGAII